jgi:hypothetical protein
LKHPESKIGQHGCEWSLHKDYWLAQSIGLFSMSKNGKQLKKKEEEEEEEERHFVQIIISSNLKRNEALASPCSTNPNSAGLVRFSQPPFRHPKQLPA